MLPLTLRCRLWKIDPAKDSTIEIRARDKMVFNMAMLCVRASETQPNPLRLLEHAVVSRC
jgi:hypothetical protein